MYSLFQSQHVRRELGKLSSGTSASMRNISQAKLFELPLPVAPYDKQKVYAALAIEAQSIIRQQSAATAKVQTVFETLLSDTFIG